MDQFLPSSASYNDNITKYEYNYEEATTILNEANWNLVELKIDEISLIKEVINLEKQKKDIEAQTTATTTETNTESNTEPNNELNNINNNLNIKNEALKTISNWEVKRNIINSFALSDEELVGNWRYKNNKDNTFSYLTINLTTVDLVDNISVAEFIKDLGKKLV
jgi:ABC-type transport system substrate-binding protein